MHCNTYCTSFVWIAALALLLLPIVAKPRPDQHFRWLHPPGKRYRQVQDLAAAVIDEGGATEAPLPPVCGQYGFRCIDDRSYQVCSLTDVNDQTDEPEAVHECAEDMLCDEDNNAYCSPRFRLVDIQPATGRRCGLRTSKRKRENPASETPKPEAGNRTDFQCEAYGMFPDTTNHSMFWFCDRGCHEHIFSVRHMMCAQQLIFDADRNECIPPAQSDQPLSTSSVTSTSLPITRTNRQRLAQLRAAQSTGIAFSCAGRPLGKYPDPRDCRRYHLCVPETIDAQKSFNEVIFACPDGTAYDPLAEACNAVAINRCVCNHRDEEEQVDDEVDDAAQNDPANSATDGRCHCSTGSRMADTNRPDGYRLCVGQAMLLLSCPLGTQFNSTMLSCQPATE